jgi:hypothetical protein
MEEIKMGLYRVILATKTSIALKPLSDLYQIDTVEFTITLRQIKSETDQIISGMQHGWFIEFEVKALDLQKAVSFAYDFSEFLLSSLTLESGVESFKTNPILGYDITDGISERDFVQYFYDNPFTKPLAAEFESYLNHLQVIWGFVGERKDRLYRSIRWFRKGIIEDDPLDQFLNLYQGLETLNPVLAEHYGIPNGGKVITEGKCVRTNETYYFERNTHAGLEKLMDEVCMDASVRRDISIVRNKIAHGTEGFQTLYNDCIRLAPVVGKLLHEGISIILGFDINEQVTKQIGNIAPVRFGGVLILEIKLHEADINKIANDYAHPYFTIKFDVEMFEDGPRIGYRVKNTCHPVFACKYSSGAFSVSGVGINIELETVE